ncbi:MAG: hypothetical protein IMY87_00985 [Chloroflexi bacterium]|nr:hypothetical protein [Chloroflexota bacterium]
MVIESPNAKQQIGVLNEKPLHAALKRQYAQPNDRFEVPIDGFLVDIVRGNLLLEIQTRNFAAVKQKLTSLVSQHHVRLVYPIAQEKWILKLAEDGQSQISRRKSPKRGTLEDIFEELVSFPELLSHPSFSIEVVLIKEEEIRRYNRTRGWRRRGWVTHERRLLQIVARKLLKTPDDLRAVIPSLLAEPFTTHDLAIAMNKSRRFAQKMVYCLRRMGSITSAGKRGNAVLYTRGIS